MTTNEYNFVTNWRVRGTVEEVAEVLSDATDLPRWWPSVYRDVEETAPGDEDGIGREVSLYTTGWLPYTLRWQFRVVASDYPHGFALEAGGDFVGGGEWTLTQDGDRVDVTYDWRISAEKPLLRYLPFLLRPVFEANHRWAMARGEEGLRLELARRRAPEDERHLVPPVTKYSMRSGGERPGSVYRRNTDEDGSIEGAAAGSDQSPEQRSTVH